MDMRKLLESMYKFAGEPEQKAGDQVRGTEKAKKDAKGGHPFRGRLVGGESTEPESNMLSELDQYTKDTKVERTLAERWEEFKEELFKDTEAKRPAREGSRPARDYGKEGEHSKRYNYNSEETDESRGHKIIATKLKDIERKPASDEDYAKHVERMKASQKEYLKKNPKSIYKQVDEYGANQPTGTAGQTMNDPQKAKQIAQATTALKSATGSSAPPTNIAQAIDAASQGKAVDAMKMKTIEPLMKDMATIASDPKLANQFKTLANQVNLVQKQQPK